MKANISDSEMKVMEKIWDQGEMVSVAAVVALLNEDGESWTHQTVLLFLSKSFADINSHLSLDGVHK